MIKYWNLFLLGLAILAGVIVWHWVTDAATACRHLLPSAGNTSKYNAAAWAMLGLGVWGLLRLLKQQPRGGPPQQPSRREYEREDNGEERN